MDEIENLNQTSSLEELSKRSKSSKSSKNKRSFTSQSKNTALENTAKNSSIGGTKGDAKRLTSPKNSKVTVSTIAQLAQVSRATVSRVLNQNKAVAPDVRARVQEVINSTGYKHTVRSQGMDQIACVCIVSDESIPFLEGSYLETFLRSISEEADKLSIRCEFLGRDKIANNALFEQSLRSCEGVIMIGMDTPALLARITRFNKPTVIVNGSDPQMKVVSIAPDSELGMFMLAEYLIDKGHTKSCLINAHIKHAMWQRSAGFRRAFEMRGLDFDEEHQIIDLCKIAPLVDPSGKLLHDISNRLAGVDFGLQYMTDYLISNHFFDGMSAVACVCDASAISLIKAFQQHGIQVPEDISVTGFDDIVMSSLISPPLTTIHIDFQQISVLALNMLKHIKSGLIMGSVRMLTGVSLKERRSVRPLM